MNINMKEVIFRLIRVMVFNLVVCTVARALGLEYNPVRYFGSYYPPKQQKINYREYYSSGRYSRG